MELEGSVDREMRIKMGKTVFFALLAVLLLAGACGNEAPGDWADLPDRARALIG